jgi:hypothetical protein
MKILSTGLMLSFFATNVASASNAVHNRSLVGCGIAPNHTWALNDMGSRAIESNRNMLSDIVSIAFDNFIMSASIEWDPEGSCQAWITDTVIVRFVPKDMKECEIRVPMSKSMLYSGEREIDAKYTWGESTIDCKFPENKGFAKGS